MSFFGREKVIVATHSGSFHADEVFACSTLTLWAEKTGNKIKIIRTRNEEEIGKADIVVDVGMQYDPKRQRFDHHQKGGAGEHTNGIPYASFGLVWKHYGEVVCEDKEVAKIIEEKLVIPVDAQDNGINLITQNNDSVSDYSVGDLVASFNPTWQEGQSIVGTQFYKAVSIAQDLLVREVACTRAEVEGYQLTKEAVAIQNNPAILILDEYIDWEKGVSVSNSVKLVVYRNRNGKDWCVQVARDNLKDYTSQRAQLPKSWGGLRGEDLASISGIPDAIFCTNGGWFGTTKSKESAIQMAKRALQGP